MTKYKPEDRKFDHGEIIEIPDNAVGIEVDRFPTFVTVQYLIPVNDE